MECLLVAIVFAGIYSRALSPVYVEGDDAKVVAFHALGRDGELQPPYSPYQSMFDAVLSILPESERLVRVTAITLSAVCAPVLFVLMLALARDWMPAATAPNWQLAGLMLLAIPELFYFGLLVSPSTVAMTILVGSHLLWRYSTRWPTPVRGAAAAASAVLFGLGVSFRWDTLLYGVTVVADRILTRTNRDGEVPLADRFKAAGLWGTLAATTWLTAVFLNGYGPSAVVQVLLSAGPVEPFNIVYFVTRVQTLLTPVFVLLCMAGFARLRSTHASLGIVALISILAVSRLAVYGVPKWVITAIPSLFAVAWAGAVALWSRPRVRLPLILLALAPWVVGVRVATAGVLWGPGFELRRLQSVPTRSERPALILGAGTAVPTPEGPRPLMGHAWVFGWEWKRFVNAYWTEEVDAVREAVQRSTPVLALDAEGWVVGTYLNLGFVTNDPPTRLIGRDVGQRRWRRSDGTTSQMFTFMRPADEFDGRWAELLEPYTGSTVMCVGFSSTLARLYARFPAALERTGSTTALIHLDRLR